MSMVVYSWPTEPKETSAPAGGWKTALGNVDIRDTESENYSGTQDGYTLSDRGGPKAKTKAKNSLDRDTPKRDNGKCYVTN